LGKVALNSSERGNSTNEIITLNAGLVSLSVSPNPFQGALNFNIAAESKAEI
jgi:hypothetical protein